MAKRNVAIRISAEDVASGVVNQIRSRFVELTGAFVSGQLIVNGLSSAFSNLTQYMRGAIAAAQEAEKIDRELQRSLQSLGIVRRSATDELSTYAASLAQTTIYEDDAIKSAMSLLVTLGRLEGEGLKRATRATLDLASATGKDLGSAAEAVAKAAAGSETALGKLGIKVDDTIPKGERFSAMLDGINERMGGAAETEANTTYGQTIALTKAIGELGEAFGRVAMSTGFTSMLAESARNITGLAQAIDETRSRSLSEASMLDEVAGRGDTSSPWVTDHLRPWVEQWASQAERAKAVIRSIYEAGDLAGMTVEEIGAQVTKALDDLDYRTPESAARSLEFLLGLLERINAQAEKVKKTIDKSITPTAASAGTGGRETLRPGEMLQPDQWMFAAAGPDRFNAANRIEGLGTDAPLGNIPPFEGWSMTLSSDLLLIDEYTEQIEKATEAWEKQQKVIGNIIGDIQGALATGIYRALTMTGDIGERLKAIFGTVLDMVIRMVAEMIAGKIAVSIAAMFLNTGGVARAAAGMTAGYSYPIAGMREASVDVVPALLTPGERVLSPAEAQRYAESGRGAPTGGLNFSIAMLNQRREARDIIRYLNERVRRRGGTLVATELLGSR